MKPKIKITLVEKLGCGGCHHGHKWGTALISTPSGGNCAPWLCTQRSPTLTFCVMAVLCRREKQGISAFAARTQMFLTFSVWKWSKLP